MNIVSIDFDIIMAPSIELYGSFENKQFYENYYNNLFNADLLIYTKLTEWLLQHFPTVGQDNIYFIESHQEIVNFIPKDEENLLINIDHHHDLGYGPPQELEKPITNLNCGNWALHLLQNKLIKDYVWIKNNNSKNGYCKYNFNSKFFYNYNLNELKPDRIIICLSSPWVPQQYHSLFYLWMNMASKLNDTQYYLIENN